MTTLVRIKLLHTAVWFFFAGCIVAIPIVGGRGHYGWAAVLIGLVLAECGVLAAVRAGELRTRPVRPSHAND